MEKNILQDGYTLVWEENFDYVGSVCAENWSCEVGEYWANNEQQAYTDSQENVRVQDGKLYITALKKKYGIRDYTSGRIPKDMVPGLLSG